MYTHTHRLNACIYNVNTYTYRRLTWHRAYVCVCVYVVGVASCICVCVYVGVCVKASASASPRNTLHFTSTLAIVAP